MVRGVPVARCRSVKQVEMCSCVSVSVFVFVCVLFNNVFAYLGGFKNEPVFACMHSVCSMQPKMPELRKTISAAILVLL